METEPVIWVLGENVPNADKSILWDSPFPNFSDPDILIVNLQSLTENVLLRIDKKKYNQAKGTILDKFLNGGTIIYITAPYNYYSDPTVYSNYDLAPVHFNTQQVQEGYKIDYDKKDNEYSPYIEQVGKFDFYLNGFDNAYALAFKMGLEPQTQIKFQRMTAYDIKDNAGHTLGCSISLPSKEGLAIFLPPATKIPMSEAIGKILEMHGKTGYAETIPSWVSDISLPNTKEKDSKIEELQLQKSQLQHQIEKLQHERQTILNHRRLLYSKDTPLEDVVAEAFKILGFNEIARIREKDREDWVFEFKFEKRFKYGVIEVKGADDKTKQQHIVQCSKWVDERFEIDKKISKGIFIPNQFRIEPYPKSKKNRSHFEPNELEYAGMKSICIIPSYSLFEAVKDELEGKKKSRAKIEKLIAETNGVLTEL